MGYAIIRYNDSSADRWGVMHEGKVTPISGQYSTLASFLNEGQQAISQSLNDTKEQISLDDLTPLSPVTRPARIVCQGVNYANHRAEAGLTVQRPDFNLFFTKADSTLCGSTDDVIQPLIVKLLDYEIELGLVIRKPITGKVNITTSNIYDYVAGFVIANDISARDVQIPQGQWYKGKSFRTFCPTGPYVYLWDEEEVAYLHDMNLQLRVNGELRQSANTSQLLYKPEETLTELSEWMDLDVGDLVLTGTPGGVALKMTGADFDQQGSTGLGGNQKLQLMLDSQHAIQNYLKPGDVITCQIKSKDGRIDLGEQVNRVVSGS